MIRRPLHFHLGMDNTGHRHVRLRDPAEMRRAHERRLLHPIVIVVAAGGMQPRWRNGLQRRRWLLLTEESRGDRRLLPDDARAAPAGAANSPVLAPAGHPRA